MNPPAGSPQRTPGFWENPWLLAALVVASGLPILMSTVPPLTDLPGHMARYKVGMDLAASPELQQFYRFEWALIGNLGVDLLVIPLARLIGLEPAVKLIVFMIPPLTTAGFLLVAREVHRRIPPAALFALPFAYNFPFLYGFVNFSLSMALAFLAFALWLRLGRLERLRLRAMVFLPLSVLLWVCHAFGWGTLGVLAFSAEWVRYRDRGESYVEAAWHAALQMIALAPPFALMLAWRSGHLAGVSEDWFNWRGKWDWIVMALRDRWAILDQLSVLVGGSIVLAALVTPRLNFSRSLAASALILTLVFILLPRLVWGSAYADMRLAPFLFAVWILGVRPSPAATARFAGGLAVAGLLFFGVRTVAGTTSAWLYGREFDRQLAALAAVPRGARLVSFVGLECRTSWRPHRLEHLPGMAVVRREAFSNEQWVMPGAQLITVDYPQGGAFIRDRSQIVVKDECPAGLWLHTDEALRKVPRTGFDYVWLINPPPYRPESVRGLTPIWRSGDSVVFRVADRRQPD